jgi:sulfur carrier protein
MFITVAGEKKEYKEGLTLPELIEIEKVEQPEYVTVSINDEFIDGDNKATTVLKDGDNVEFLYFMGGGQPQ